MKLFRLIALVRLPVLLATRWTIFGGNNPIEHALPCRVWKTVCKSGKNLLPLQPGDVPDTYANVDALVQDVWFGKWKLNRAGMLISVRWWTIVE